MDAGIPIPGRGERLAASGPNDELVQIVADRSSLLRLIPGGSSDVAITQRPISLALGDETAQILVSTDLACRIALGDATVVAGPSDFPLPDGASFPLNLGSGPGRFTHLSVVALETGSGTLRVTRFS